jgi:hypothetical protein
MAAISRVSAIHDILDSLGCSQPRALSTVMAPRMHRATGMSWPFPLSSTISSASGIS